MFTFVKNYKSVRSPARLNICDTKKFLRFDSITAKNFMLLNDSKRKEVLAVRRTQAQASAISRKKLPGLRTQKEVLARALFLGYTVRYVWLFHKATSTAFTVCNNSTPCEYQTQSNKNFPRTQCNVSRVDLVLKTYYH